MKLKNKNSQDGKFYAVTTLPQLSDLNFGGVRMVNFTL